MHTQSKNSLKYKKTNRLKNIIVIKKEDFNKCDKKEVYKLMYRNCITFYIGKANRNFITTF